MDPLDPVEVYTTFSQAQAEMIRIMLDAEGIQARVAGSAQGAFTGATPEVAVMVHAADAPRARQLITEYQRRAAQTPDTTE